MAKLLYSTSAFLMIVATLCITKCSGSAIPMWEFLSKGEKMSHLYTMFAKQVSTYCKTNSELPVAQCKRDLLVYGIDKLEKMSESYLDSMDPYQRGANDIIWDAMMEGHTLNQHKKEKTTVTPIYEPIGQYQRNPIFDDNNNNNNNNNNYNNNKNKNNNYNKKHSSASSSSSSSSSSSPSYANGMDDLYNSYYNYPTAIENIYEDPSNHLPSATNIDYQFDYPSAISSGNGGNVNYLSGPMIIRVRPDGTPVEEDKLKPLPTDDDREAMTIGKEKIPTIQQISDTFTGPSSNQRRQSYYLNYRTTDRRLTNSH